MKTHTFYLAFIAILLSAIYAQAQTVNLKGTINESKIQMTLTRSSDELSGSYFYEKQGSANKLNLKGKINGNDFTLVETDAAGKSTGAFKGIWKDDETTSGIALEGTWKKPRGGEDAGFYAYQQNIYFTGSTTFITRKITENNKLKFFEVDVEYPEITSSTNPNSAKFNLLARQMVAGTVAEFRKNMLGMTAEDIKFSKQRGVPNDLVTGYSAEYSADDFVSIQFTTSTYEGGAHPNSFTTTLNYDLKNGRELKLADLFQPKSNYLKAISDYSIADLKKRLTDMSDDEWIKTGAGAEVENFSSWNLTAKGLMINFNPYQVAAYAAGPQTVIIPYEQLRSILKPDSVVNILKK
jgi:hypothetical protein